MGRSSEESLSVAGEEDSGHVSTMRIYDSATDSGASAHRCPAVENPAVAAEGGKLYVFGGSASGSFSGSPMPRSSIRPQTHGPSCLRCRRHGAARPPRPWAARSTVASARIVPSSRRWTPRSRFRRLELGRRDGDPAGQRGSAVLGALYVFGGGTRNTTGGYAEGNSPRSRCMTPTRTHGFRVRICPRDAGPWWWDAQRPGAADRWRTEGRRRQLP